MRWERLRRLVKWVLSFELARPRTAIAMSLVLASCAGAMTPRGKLDDAVQETNMAARFGRTDIAAERVAPGARAAFLKKHRQWGNEVRIVDVEYGGVEKMSNEEAVILVGFGWYRPTDGVLRTTVVRQTWKNDKGVGPWFLFDEERVGGDVGLLGEPTKVIIPEKKNVQFETTVIR